MTGLLRNVIDSFRKSKSVQADEVEIEKTVNIEIQGMRSTADVNKIATLLREGKIVFAISKIDSMEEYKKNLSELKKVCMEINGDIVAIGERNILVAPSFVKIAR